MLFPGRILSLFFTSSVTIFVYSSTVGEPPGKHLQFSFKKALSISLYGHTRDFPGLSFSVIIEGGIFMDAKIRQLLV